MESPFSNAAQQGVKIIETMRVEHDKTIALLPFHLKRLEQTALKLGYDFDKDKILELLENSVEGGVRLRLTIGANGHLEQTQSPLPQPAPLWRIALYGERLHASNPWLGVKTTKREFYETARLKLPQNLEEWIFQNERGELCEGTITTVFVDMGQGLLTPPLSSGVLPGVLRESLLEARRCREAIIPIEAIYHAKSLWVGNAVRGLIPAILHYE